MPRYNFLDLKGILKRCVKLIRIFDLWNGQNDRTLILKPSCPGGENPEFSIPFGSPVKSDADLREESLRPKDDKY